MSTRHKWGPKTEAADRSWKRCHRCGMVRVSRHEFEGGRSVHWKEFWLDCDRVDHDATPPCDARLELEEAA